jgi:hypothetical protein
MVDHTNRAIGRILLAIFLMGGCGGGGANGPGGNTETGGETGGEPTGGKATGGTSTGGTSTGGTSTGGMSGTGGRLTVDAAPEPEGTGGVTGGSGSDAAGKADSVVPDSSAPTCGMAGQMCCPGNTCSGGAMPMTTGGGGGGMTVLELHASGSDPYKYFASKDLLPIDGPDSGYIFDQGDSFRWVMHQTGAEETVSSGAKRQRNELTVNPGNPARYKGMHGDTMSYTWRFKLTKMNADPTWCDIFQVKQYGTLGPAPFMALEANKGDLTLDTQRLGVVTKVPLSTIMGMWIHASVTARYSETGSLQVTLKKEDGTVVLSYKNDNINLWGAGLEFVRPKWGFYRNQRAGAGEAEIFYNDMTIIRGTIGTGNCTCK